MKQQQIIKYTLLNGDKSAKSPYRPSKHKWFAYFLVILIKIHAKLFAVSIK